MLKGNTIIFDRSNVFDDPLEWEFNIQYDIFELCEKQFGRETALYFARKWWGDCFADVMEDE